MKLKNNGKNIINIICLVCYVLAFVISLFIEVNQLLFQVGTFQISDLVYNTLSGLIGYILYRILYKE